MDYTELDEKVIPLVKLFNENGLKTIMSCQGHNKTNLSMFWIQFSKDVSEDDIVDFMNKHLNNMNCFTSNGRFVQRFYVANGKVFRRYQYMAATVEAATQDYKNWSNL